MGSEMNVQQGMADMGVQRTEGGWLKEIALSQFLVLTTAHFHSQRALGASETFSDAASTKKPTVVPPGHIVSPLSLPVSYKPFSWET